MAETTSQISDLVEKADNITTKALDALSKENYNEAFKLFNKGANIKIPADNSQTLSGDSQSYGDALKRYKLRIKLRSLIGDNKAFLAHLYQQGRGTRKDYKKAITLAQNALELETSYTIALQVLSIAYNDGLGTKKDVNKAKSFTKKACELGSEVSCGALKDIFGE